MPELSHEIATSVPTPNILSGSPVWTALPIGTLRINRNGNMGRFVSVDTDDYWMYGLHNALVAPNAQAPIRGDRTVMGRPRQAPMRSHLARCRGDLTVDTSTQ